jgi:hypothetical protein
VTHIDSPRKAALPLKSVVHLALWAAVAGLAFGGYVTYAYLQAA